MPTARQRRLSTCDGSRPSRRLLTDADAGLKLALIWLAHIGMERAVSYGLKYPTSFKDTHLQRV